MRSLIVICIIVVSFMSLAYAQDYVGSETCGNCHVSKFDEWEESGHHYKLNQVVNSQAPVYPFEVFSGTPNVVDPPYVFGNQLSWGDVSYVIGGYYWKARFIDHDGYIYTGSETDATQWNIHTQSWVGYHAGEVDKPYNCGTCHTTGYDSEGNQGGLEGLIGTWEEEGIGCEACHGPGGDHYMSPSQNNIIVDESNELCGECHTRDSENRIAVSGTFIKHHEQYDEMLHSPHYDDLTCNTCHEPHKSTVYDEGGLKSSPTCANCHNGYEIAGKEELECWDCHMPYSAKSAVAYSENEGDVTSHQFKIWVTTFPKDSMFYTDASGTFVKTDGSGEVYGNTLDFVCLRCHDSWTIDDVYEIADGIHDEGLHAEPVFAGSTPSDYVLLPNYPNPFNPVTNIAFELPQDGFVNLSVFDVSGRLVSEIYAGNSTAGKHSYTFEAENLPSGIYVSRLSTDAGVFSQKMLLVK